MQIHFRGQHFVWIHHKNNVSILLKIGFQSLKFELIISLIEAVTLWGIQDAALGLTVLKFEV